MSGEVVETMWEGRFLVAKRRGNWEYAARKGDIAAAVIVAIEDVQVILVEQFRAPLGARCLELPAGLVGDEEPGESIATSAARELEEETGYRPAHVELLGEYFSSPGMSDERFTLVRATGLTRVGPGGGTADEDIVVHHVKLEDLPGFVAGKRAEGVAIDVKMLLLLAPSLLG